VIFYQSLHLTQLFFKIMNFILLFLLLSLKLYLFAGILFSRHVISIWFLYFLNEFFHFINSLLAGLYLILQKIEIKRQVMVQYILFRCCPFINCDYNSFSNLFIWQSGILGILNILHFIEKEFFGRDRDAVFFAFLFPDYEFLFF